MTEPVWPRNLKYLLLDAAGHACQPHSPPSLREEFPRTYRLPTARAEEGLDKGAPSHQAAEPVPWRQHALLLGVPSQGRGLRLTLSAPLCPTRHHAGTQQTRTTCGAHALSALLFKPPCLPEKQTDSLGNHVRHYYLIIYACKWGSSLDEKHPCVSASWSARE